MDDVINIEVACEFHMKFVHISGERRENRCKNCIFT
jgi:hypothetical protein